MVINEEAKIKIFAIRSMAQMYGKTDEDLGRFCRGLYQGVLAVLGALDLKNKDILPAECPDDARTTYASFCALYGAYLNAERKPRLDKDCEEHKMMYGKEAQEMMAEAERVLEEINKQKKARDN